MRESDCLKLCNRLYCDIVANGCVLSARQVVIHRAELITPRPPVKVRRRSNIVQYNRSKKLKADILAILAKIRRQQYDRERYERRKALA